MMLAPSAAVTAHPKDMLVAAYLIDRERRWRRVVETAVADPGLSPIERVTAPFEALHNWMQQSPRGCAFINAIAELPDPEHPAHRVAAAEKRWLLDLFEGLATDAGIVPAAELAHRLLCLHEGALALRPALPEPIAWPLQPKQHVLWSQSRVARPNEPSEPRQPG